MLSYDNGSPTVAVLFGVSSKFQNTLQQPTTPSSPTSSSISVHKQAHTTLQNQ